jgi:hypothetical protein
MSRTPRFSSVIAWFTLSVALGLAIALAPASAKRGEGGGRPKPPPPPAGSPEALLAALDMAYVQEITTHLTTIGANPMGFRVFGTPQDSETANYLAGEMRALGLSRVKVERVPGDGWLFEGGSVEVSGVGLDDTFDVSSLGSVPGTPSGGVTGEVVFVGYGTAPEYAGLDVAGKIVFAWWDFDGRGIWPNLIATEAALHGATAAIIASGPGHIWYQAGGGDALGSNDGECSSLCAPMVVISKNNANALNSALARGPVNATVTLDATNLYNATGYQAIGQITGIGRPDKVIVFTAHHDAWFTSAADDSVGVAMMLAVAKAAKDSGYRPYYTWVFAPVTGEEYGLADAYADWLQGAWHRVSQSHTEWSDDAVVVFNWETHAPPYPLTVNLSHEMLASAQASLFNSQTGGMVGSAALYDVFSWTDGYVYEATGTPSLTFAAVGVDYWQRYHTNYDSLDTLDFPSLAPTLRAETKIALEIDKAVIPYAFDTRVQAIGASLDVAVMDQYGANSAGVTAALAALSAAAAASASAPYSECAFDHTRAAARIIEDEYTSLHVNEGTVGPHQQVQQDLVNLEGTIAWLQQGSAINALAALGNVGTNGFAGFESRESFDLDLLYRDPNYEKVSWAGTGQFPPLLDLYDVWHSINAKGQAGMSDFSAEIAELSSHVPSETAVYRLRIDQLTATLDDATAELAAVSSCSN